MNTSKLAPLLVVFLVAASFAPAATAHAGTDRTTILVGNNGDASFQKVTMLDLTTEEGQNEFERLNSSQAAKDEYKTQLLNEMRGYADQHPNSNSTDISEIQLRLNRQQDDGVIQARFGWRNFAQVTDDGRVIVDKPLPAEFSPDQQTVLVAPEGYQITTSENIGDAQIQQNSAIVWPENPSFEELYVVFEEGENPPQDDDSSEPDPPQDDDSSEPDPPQQNPTEPDDSTSETESAGGFTFTQLIGFGFGTALLTIAGVLLYRM